MSTNDAANEIEQKNKHIIDSASSDDDADSDSDSSSSTTTTTSTNKSDIKINVQTVSTTNEQVNSNISFDSKTSKINQFPLVCHHV